MQTFLAKSSEPAATTALRGLESRLWGQLGLEPGDTSDPQSCQSRQGGSPRGAREHVC